MQLSDNIEDLVYTERELVNFGELEEHNQWYYIFKFKRRYLYDIVLTDLDGKILSWKNRRGTETPKKFRNARGIL